MPDWVVERGIGESRYARIEDGEIVEARTLQADRAFEARRVDLDARRFGQHDAAVADRGGARNACRHRRGRTLGRPFNLGRGFGEITTRNGAPPQQHQGAEHDRHHHVAIVVHG